MDTSRAAVDENTLRVLANQYFETSDLSLRKAIYGELRDTLIYSKNPAYIASLRAAQKDSQDKMKDWAIPKPITHAAA
ncbi:hypothetical protein QBC38DRAFT_451618 [Podospora fimiseda]|uniref:Uncharacterized protein n=1 Tax=Podospora fimiseda TaxID=252190 RepID=A0AAN7BXE3_9PEZI|nr:hypothetical protein QBC38DRAFT_451618 [Podospora fimiseda]